MNEITDTFLDQEPNGGFLLGCDVKKSRGGSEGKKNGNNSKDWLRRAYFKMVN